VLPKPEPWASGSPKLCTREGYLLFFLMSLTGSPLRGPWQGAARRRIRLGCRGLQEGRTGTGAPD
jgi:hypothetical protein